MREVHAVAVSEDGSALLLATTPDGSATFRLGLDERVREALRRPVTAGSGRAAGGASPREIQARLRAGAEVAELAAEFGVPEERLEPYAAPVLTERARVLEDALAARMSRPQRGPSTLPLGAAVKSRLPELIGGQPEAVEWSARRTEAATWVVRFRYAGDGAVGSAEWGWDRSAHSLIPLDAAAAELGHVGLRRDRPATAAAATTAGRLSTDSGGPVRPDAPATGGAEVPSRIAKAGRRAAVPAWADVLLGVGGPAEPAVGPGSGSATG